ncbi:MAG: PilC/PilY family type IV pilus protein [Acidobacteria bacterium]|nr:PilC/PilY family type IV pilus protein [Acidobacteriota bacterium]
MRSGPEELPVAVRGSSTLLVTLILLLLSGSCLALLVATQTQMLIASGQKLQARLLAAAEGGLQLAIARGIAGSAEPYSRTLVTGKPGAEIALEATGFFPVANGVCHLCMANLDGALSSLGGLRRVSHVAGAAAVAPPRLDGLPPPTRELTAVVDLMPWPAGDADAWDLSGTAHAARGRVRDAALTEIGAYDDDAPLTVKRLAGRDSDRPRTVTVGGLGRAGRLLYAFELSPEPRLLWRFADSRDEDGNGEADLGYTVSKPSVVSLRFGQEVHPVAIFGGGFDPARSGGVGNWLYFVAINGGEVLYKRALDGPVVAAPAVVDAAGDGLADRVYIGTTEGSLYRVDLSPAVELEGGRVPAGAWKPRQVFDTGGLPIHHPPAVIPLRALGTRALALGAGGGADPGAGTEEPAAGRFQVFVEGVSGGSGTADELPQLDGENPLGGVDRLSPVLSPREQGWSLALGAGERPASPPLVAGGLLTFFTLRPTGPDGGEIRKYALQLVSGDAAGASARARLVGRSASSPASVLGSPTRIEIDHAGSSAAEVLESDELATLEKLRARMPERCRFDGSRIRLIGSGPDGLPMRLAVLPVCRIQADWAEGGP